MSFTAMEPIRNATRDEVLEAVRLGTTLIVWQTQKGLLVLQPEASEVITLLGETFSLLGPKALASCPEPPIFVSGVSGIAATDQNWDGVRDIDEMTARNLWNRVLQK